MLDSALQPIRNDAEYRATLSRIGAIFENGKALPSDSAEWRRITALLALVDAWEHSGEEAESADSEVGTSSQSVATQKIPTMNASF